MSFYQRVTDALRDTTPGPWTQPFPGEEVIGDGNLVVARAGNGPFVRNAALIAAAPSMLSEAARRLDPQGVDVAGLARSLRHRAGFVDPYAYLSDDDIDAMRRAAELLERAYLDPQETT